MVALVTNSGGDTSDGLNFLKKMLYGLFCAKRYRNEVIYWQMMCAIIFSKDNLKFLKNEGESPVMRFRMVFHG